jgi:hypothetical protein
MATSINEVEGGFHDFAGRPLKSSLRRWNVGLFISTLFGLVFGLGGLTIGFLTISELLSSSTTLYVISTLFIGASFVLFGIAAHCLDRVDAADKAIRLEYCRQHGLSDKSCESEADETEEDRFSIFQN